MRRNPIFAQCPLPLAREPARACATILAGECVLAAKSSYSKACRFSGNAACALMLGAALVGCAKPEAPPPAPPPTALPPHAGPPPAAQCSVNPFSVRDGGTANVVMSVSNEGGYCAATLTTEGGVPFAAPLVPVAPLHGIPRVVRYNGKTSVEYAPQPGFVGHDSFIVKLIVRGKPGYTTLNMSVNAK